MEIAALAQEWVQRVLRPGDLAIDATVGNGNDTVFLARSVGPGGIVIGFDIQTAAIESARRKAEAEGVLERVRLFRESHVKLAERVGADFPDRRPRVVMFNLGYLPGGDKTITTRADDTVSALQAAVDCLAVGGVVAVVMYPGHEEGGREADAVLSWAANLRGAYEAAEVRLVNRSALAPRLLIIARQERAFS